MRYASEDELLKVLNGFESGTIARDDWGHPEHLIVAFFYCSGKDANAAYMRMKEGILKLLDAFGIDRTEEMPYHETMTKFWILTVHSFVLANPELSPVESCAGLIANYGKDYPLEFYTRELLFSDRARAAFIEPDLKPFEFPTPIATMQE